MKKNKICVFSGWAVLLSLSIVFASASMVIADGTADARQNNLAYVPNAEDGTITIFDVISSH
ncbi:MAG: hypothetical protein JRG73_11810 [Deltaproteobacteria bacterium]|nr:hypothetical protein [Deltaproteobacteria bacterium]MBW2307607.1 hypothetical protein [Deltaproteobacteria bacterium]